MNVSGTGSIISVGLVLVAKKAGVSVTLVMKTAGAIAAAAAILPVPLLLRAGRDAIIAGVPRFVQRRPWWPLVLPAPHGGRVVEPSL